MTIKEFFRKLLGKAETEIEDLLEYGKGVANGALATFEALADELEHAVSSFSVAKADASATIDEAEAYVYSETQKLQDYLAGIKATHEARITEATEAAAKAAKAAANIRALVS